MTGTRIPGVNGARAAALIDVKLSVGLEATGAAVTGGAGGVSGCSPAVLLNPADPVGVVAGADVLDTRPFAAGAAGGDAFGVVLTTPAGGAFVGVGALAIRAVLGRVTGVLPAVEVKPGVTVGVVCAGVGVAEVMAVRGVGVVWAGVAEVMAVRGVGVVDSLAGLIPEARARRGGAAESALAAGIPVVKALRGVGVVRAGVGVVAIGGVRMTGEGVGVAGRGVSGRGLTGAGVAASGTGRMGTG